MRTTVTLAPDVAAAVAQRQREKGSGISDVVNELVRRGLVEETRAQRFEQTRSAMGLPQQSLDDVAGLLDALEGDARRS